MTAKEARVAYENRKLVHHKENENNYQTVDYISCFDDDESGVYLAQTHIFIPIADLVLFDVRKLNMLEHTKNKSLGF